jgi:hypothetical protein
LEGTASATRFNLKKAALKTQNQNMPNLEELPVFEGKRDGRIRRGYDLWDSRHGRDDSKLQARLIDGILKKNVGQPWVVALKELHAKVKGLRGERTMDIIGWRVEYDTWMENGQVMAMGWGGPEPIRAATFYIDPITRILCHRQPRKNIGPFQVPEEMEGEKPGERYIRTSAGWYRVRFTLEQLKTLKTGKVSKREKTWHAGARHRGEQKLIRGSDVIDQESRTVHVTHQTDHRRFPANWQWRHYAHEWKEVMDASIGCNQEAVMAKLSVLPAIPDTRKAQSNPPACPLEYLASSWILNVEGSRNVSVKWAPYRFNRQGLLDVNPEPDNFELQITVKPSVQPLGGKPLARLKAKIEKMRVEQVHERYSTIRI